MEGVEDGLKYRGLRRCEYSNLIYSYLFVVRGQCIVADTYKNKIMNMACTDTVHGVICMKGIWNYNLISSKNPIDFCLYLEKQPCLS